MSQADYFYLTPINKVAVEQRITAIRGMSDPQISPEEISSILGIQPRRDKSSSRIRCTWSEKNREIEAYRSTPWKFQRRESRGF